MNDKFFLEKEILEKTTRLVESQGYGIKDLGYIHV